MSLHIRLLDDTGAPDLALSEQLKQDLDREVGDAEYLTGAAAPGARGDPLTMTIVLALLNAKAIESLVRVLGSYLTRDRSGEIEVSGPGGTVRLKLPQGQPLADLDIAGYIAKAQTAPGAG